MFLWILHMNQLGGCLCPNKRLHSGFQARCKHTKTSSAILSATCHLETTACWVAGGVCAPLWQNGSSGDFSGLTWMVQLHPHKSWVHEVTWCRVTTLDDQTTGGWSCRQLTVLICQAGLSHELQNVCSICFCFQIKPFIDGLESITSGHS